MNTKFTPGPWEYDSSGKYYKPCIRTNGVVIALLYRQTTVTPEEYEANNHLLAAAPELLVALKELCTLPNKHRPDKVWEQAKTAIAKAEGSL